MFNRIASMAILILFLGRGVIFAQETKPSLIHYLQHPDILKSVLKLAQTGYASYQKNPLKSQLSAAKWDALGGGRQKNWIEQTFGKTETLLTEEFSALPPPYTWTTGEIDDAYKSAITASRLADTEKPTFLIVENVGINGLHRTSLGRGAIVQLASQFNYLESPGSHQVPVTDYLYDQTQGPQGVIEAAAATLYRNAVVIEGKLPHALHAVLPTGDQKYYKNGYLELGRLSEEHCERLKKVIEANLSKFEILPQWVLCESSGAEQLQVFAAAPSFQGVSCPQPASYAAQIADMIVVKQYEMIAKLAVIRSIAIGTRVPVHLTLVGQGAFNNPHSIIENALNAVARVVKGRHVDVYVHVFSMCDKAKLMNNLCNPLFKIVHLTREEFKNRNSDKDSKI